MSLYLSVSLSVCVCVCVCLCVSIYGGRQHKADGAPVCVVGDKMGCGIEHRPLCLSVCLSVCVYVCVSVCVCVLVSTVGVNTRLTGHLSVWSVIRWVVVLSTELTANVLSSSLTTPSRSVIRYLLTYCCNNNDVCLCLSASVSVCHHHY